ESRQCLIYFLHYRVEIKAVAEELGDLADASAIGAEPPAPLVQAAAGSGARVLGIERKKHHGVAIRGIQGGDGLFRKRMPVAHGNEAPGIHTAGLQACLQRPRLLFGELPDGRSAADDLVVVADFLRARSGDELGQSPSPQARK